MKKDMRVAVVESADAGLLIKQASLPKLDEGHALVRVVASALNPLDTKIRAGRADHARHPFPAVLGMDMSGVVVEIAKNVTCFRPGDEVYGMVGGVGGHQGTLAEFIAVDADLLARKPAKLSFREAAALPLASITAWEGLVDRAKVAAGECVMVQGGAGAVGHIVVQIALARGARVMATASPSDFGFLDDLGAVPMNYRQFDSTEIRNFTEGHDFDVIYDTVGGAALDASFGLVRRYTGRVVSCLGWGTHSLAPLSMRGASYAGVFTLLPLLTGAGRRHHGEILAEVAKLAEAGQLHVRVDPREIRLENVTAAYDDLAAGRNKGKLVVDIQAPAS